MPTPEIWGPAVWTLFHTLAEKIHEEAFVFPKVKQSLFATIVSICKYLPCPECSTDASRIMSAVKPAEYANKTAFKNMLYLFHNRVNAKKRKRLFNYAFMRKYESANIPQVIFTFIQTYNTRGNMKLLAESFQRKFVVQNFVSWFRTHAGLFRERPVVALFSSVAAAEADITADIVENTVNNDADARDVTADVVDAIADITADNVINAID